MPTIKIETNSYITYSIDDDFNEVIIGNVKSFSKGDGKLLVNQVIEIYKNMNNGYKLTLCACPQDDSISLEDLIQFWQKLGFTADSEQGSNECLLMTF